MRTLNPTPPHLGLSRRALERELEIATAFLSAQAGVTRVWLFGSAAKGRRLDWRSYN
jgi:predicted nucleotidyltransferase